MSTDKQNNATTGYETGMRTIEDVLADLLKLAEEYEVKIESEWGSARSLQKNEEEGDLPIEIANARAAIACQAANKRNIQLLAHIPEGTLSFIPKDGATLSQAWSRLSRICMPQDMGEKNCEDLIFYLSKRNAPLQRCLLEWRDGSMESIAKITDKPMKNLSSAYISWYQSIPLEVRGGFTGVETNLSELAFYAGVLAYVEEGRKEKNSDN